MTAASDPVDAPVTKLDDYRARIAVSDAAAEAATTERDRAFHRRASSIWRKLIDNIGETERRVASKTVAKPVGKKATAAGLFKQT